MYIFFVMRRFGIALLVTVMILVGSAARADREIPAFPGAEGFGSHTPGGRGGRVIEVTNLNSDGPGSLREACSAKGPRIVVFRVGGTIEISRGLSIREPFITIAGQSAPGDGICLRGGTLGVHTHDVVIRYLRVRVGDSPEGPDPENRDCIDISGDADRVYNVVIDHCSFSWSTDENVATWYGPRDVTIQWCITSESLNDSLHPKGPHGKGMILGSQDNTITIHHCIFAHNADRNPLIGDTGKNVGASIFDFRNNVIYNHGAWVCTNVRGTSHVNYVGNVIKIGPDGLKDRPRGVRFDADAEQLFFVKDNIWPGQTEEETDDWRILGEGRPSPDRLRSAGPISAPPVTTETAENAYESVLQFAGAILPVRDVIDDRLVQEVRTGTGLIINAPAEVGGWPKYQSSTPPDDSDHDGMTDDWERRYGLDPQDSADSSGDMDGDGYTNVEEYLNGTDPAEMTATQPMPQHEPRRQQGNENLRFGRAREVEPPEIYDPANREAFVLKVKASGKEAADYLGIKFVSVPAGEFMKGEVKVILTKPFEMSIYEITQNQWVRVMNTKPWTGQEYAQDAPDNAMTYVSWNDCQEFIARLNACGESQYRLPTEAEWEYAFRAGSTSKSGFGFDENEIAEFAWYFNNTVRAEEKYAHPVGQKKSNAWGIFDMTGNAHEWCHDWYGYWYWSTGERGASVRTDPTGADPGEYRVLSGGSFYYKSRQIFIYPQSEHRPDYRGFDVGFRVIRLAP